MKNFLSAVWAIAILFLIAGNGYSDDKLHKDHKFFTRLSSFNEVHFVAGPPAALRGAISSGATGSFSATLNKSEDLVEYTLHYEGLESDITQSHIHFGQRHTVGGIVVWLCQTDGTRAPAAVAAATPFCPGAREGTVSGTFNAAQVLAQSAQGIDAGEFDELIRAIRAGAAYANAHTTTNTPGEIRGQIKSAHEHHD
jgi:CHRD domain-containing protein